MGKLGLIRHGQTELNRKGVLVGCMDVPLNSSGLGQVRALAEKLAGEKIDHIYSSGLQRAYRTAEIIADRVEASITVLTGFNELSQGRWEGLSLKEIKEKYPGQWEKWRRDPVNFTPDGGESVPQVYDRVVECLERLLPELKGKQTLIVAHQVTNICLRCYLEGIDLEKVWKFEVGNATINWLNI